MIVFTLQILMIFYGYKTNQKIFFLKSKASFLMSV